MFCTTCFGHPTDCTCGVLQPKNAPGAVAGRQAANAEYECEQIAATVADKLKPKHRIQDPRFPDVPNDGVSRGFYGHVIHCGNCGKPKNFSCRVGSCTREQP